MQLEHKLQAQNIFQTQSECSHAYGRQSAAQQFYSTTSSSSYHPVNEKKVTLEQQLRPSKVTATKMETKRINKQTIKQTSEEEEINRRNV